MTAYEGENLQLQAFVTLFSALRSESFTPGEGASYIHWGGGRVVAISGLHAVEERTISCAWREYHIWVTQFYNVFPRPDISSLLWLMESNKINVDSS